MTDFKLIKCQLNLNLRNITNVSAVHTPKSDFKIQMATSVCVSDLIQIDQMSIIIIEIIEAVKCCLHISSAHNKACYLRRPCWNVNSIK